MELLDGRSLYERRPHNLDELVEIARQVCAALDHAHAHGIIHRDLKPENVIVSGTLAASGGPDPAFPGQNGDEGLRVNFTDFGLARSVASRLTTEGGIVGTVYYLPPEQALGKELDGRPDLYALGVMLYELAAGRLPYGGDDPLTVISQHLHTPVVPPTTFNPEIPRPLEALILKLMSKLPEDRPGSAAEVAYPWSESPAEHRHLGHLGHADRTLAARPAGARAAGGLIVNSLMSKPPGNAPPANPTLSQHTCC